MTDEVNNEIEPETPAEGTPKFYLLEFSYTEPVSGNVLVAAQDEEHAIEIALESVPEQITDFAVAGVQEVSKEQLEGMITNRTLQ